MCKPNLHIRPLVTSLGFVTLLALVGCTPNYNSNYTPPPKLLYRLSGHSFWAESVSWSPSGKLLASASSDGSARVWDVASRQTVKQLLFPAGSGEIVAWSPDDKYLATISAEPGDYLKIWDTTTWNMVAHMDPGNDATYKGLPGGMAWSPDSKYLAVSPNGYANNDIGRIKVYDTSNWQLAMTLDAPGSAGELSWSPDGVSIAFGSAIDVPGGSETTLDFWNTRTNNVITLTDPDVAAYGLIAWSPDGKYVAGAPGGEGKGGRDVAIWDVNTSRKIQTLTGHTETVTSLTWSLDSKKLASGAYDKSVLIWDVDSGQMLENFKHSDVVFDVAWSPNGNTLATACADSLIYVWDVSSLGGSPTPGKR